MTIVCQHSTRERRRVSSELHRQAFAEYGFTYPQPRGAFELDHLIPLELGGDNAIANLWPGAAEPNPASHEKDRVEHFLHRQVCAGVMSLADAQRQIATDWIKVWRRRALARHLETGRPSSPNPGMRRSNSSFA